MNKKLIISILIILVIVCVSVFALTTLKPSTVKSIYVDEDSLKDAGSLIVDSKSLNKSRCKFHSDSNDVNSILVKNGGYLKLYDSTVYKTSSAFIPSDDAKYYGANSAILVNTNGTLDISDVVITTSSETSNGIFVSNADASSGVYSQDSGDNGQIAVKGKTKANIKDVKIVTEADNSRGIAAAFNGAIDADGLQIETDGQNSPAISTGPGEGKIHVKNSELTTDVGMDNGVGSPLVYSTGNVTVENTQGTSYASQIAYINGNNSVELSGCDFTGYGYDNLEYDSNRNDSGGIFIYQSTDWDDENGTSLFKAKDSKLSISSDSSQYKDAPMIHVTNTDCVIDLENTEFDFGSGEFLDVSSQGQWGINGSNGGSVALNTHGEKIEGSVVVDNISSIEWDMNDTDFKGTIESTGNATINVNEGSTWTLTGYSSVSGLKVSGNIDYGDYKLVVAGKTYDSSHPFKG